MHGDGGRHGFLPYRALSGSSICRSASGLPPTPDSSSRDELTVEASAARMENIYDEYLGDGPVDVSSPGTPREPRPILPRDR